jgi:hypothetical protein
MRQNGFQLLDCLITVLVIAILGGIGASSFSALQQRHKLHRCGLSLFDRVIRARSLAVSLNQPVSVVVLPELNRYGFGWTGTVPATWYRLEPGLQFSAAPRKPIHFYSRGVAVPGGTISISGEMGEFKVVVAPGGRIRWEYPR